MQTTSERKVKTERDANIFGKVGLTARNAVGLRPLIQFEGEKINYAPILSELSNASTSVGTRSLTITCGNHGLLFWQRIHIPGVQVGEAP